MAKKSQIDSYDPLKEGNSDFEIRHYRDGYDEDGKYNKELYE